MLAENLFDKIGFTNEMVDEYKKYKSLIKDKFEVLAAEMVAKDIYILDSCKKAREMFPEICEYTVDLMFIIECTGYLLEKYRKNSIPEHMFYDSMRDISCKAEECMKVKNVFGTFVCQWFSKFFNLTRFAFGRLQYNITRHEEDEIKIGNQIIQKGDFVLWCHIPSLGPLLHEECVESYKNAYNYFKDELKDNTLVICCDSWLLMPDYMELFKECSPNIYKFAKDYEIFGVNYTENFTIGWRIFNTDVIERNTESLPQVTKLQKGFVEHINNGGKFGSGKGVLFFNGLD